MFEMTSRLAEGVAAGVSRRRFLGSLGRYAAATAVGIAGLLATGRAQADPDLNWRCCCYSGPGCSGHYCVPASQSCPVVGCPLVSDTLAKNCAGCDCVGK